MTVEPPSILSSDSIEQDAPYPRKFRSLTDPIFSALSSFSALPQLSAQRQLITPSAGAFVSILTSGTIGFAFLSPYNKRAGDSIQMYFQHDNVVLPDPTVVVGLYKSQFEVNPFSPGLDRFVPADAPFLLASVTPVTGGGFQLVELDFTLPEDIKAGEVLFYAVSWFDTPCFVLRCPAFYSVADGGPQAYRMQDRLYSPGALLRLMGGQDGESITHFINVPTPADVDIDAWRLATQAGPPGINDENYLVQGAWIRWNP
jgi:hypothetical protein